MTYKKASEIARRTPFGGQLPEEVAAVLRAKAGRQAARSDMTSDEKSIRRRFLQTQTGV